MLAGLTFMLPLAVELHYNYLLKGGQINVWFIQLVVLSVVLSWLAIKQRSTQVKEEAPFELGSN